MKNYSNALIAYLVLVWASSSAVFTLVPELLHWSGRVPAAAGEAGGVLGGKSSPRGSPRDAQTSGAGTWRCLWSLVSSLSLSQTFRISSVSSLRPQNAHQECWAASWLSRRGSCWLFTWGQTSPGLSSVYTLGREGAQLSLGPASSSLMRPLEVASQSIIALMTECELPWRREGTLGRHMLISHALAYSFLRTFSFRDVSAHLACCWCFFSFSISVLAFSPEDLFCHFDGKVGDRRGKCMCLIYHCVCTYTDTSHTCFWKDTVTHPVNSLGEKVVV